MASPITCSGARSPRVASGGDPPTPCTRSSVTPLQAASAASCTLGSTTECRGIGISDLRAEGRNDHAVIQRIDPSAVDTVSHFPRRPGYRQFLLAGAHGIQGRVAENAA